MAKQPSTSPDSPADAAPAGAAPESSPEREAAVEVAAAEDLPEDPDEPEPEDDDGPLDLENRELCPDGACIGVIGPDGRCKLCRAEPASAAAAIAGNDAQGDSSSETVPCGDEDEDEDEDDPASPDFAARTLCADGACIGVIGPDGLCKVCGKPYTDQPDE